MNFNKTFMSLFIGVLMLTSAVIPSFMNMNSNIKVQAQTSPTPIDFQMGIVGDHGWDNSGAKVKSVIENMRSHGVDLVLHPGDFSYSTSTCSTSSTTKAWWSAWQTLPVPKIAALGNHDGTCQSDFLAKYKSSSGQTSWTWSVVANGVMIININTEYSSGTDSNQVNFVKERLIAAQSDPNVKWIVVQMHKQMKSSSSGDSHMPITALWNAYSQMFNDYGVDLVIQAHMHNYERMKNNEYTQTGCTNQANYEEKCGPTYFIVGTGGRNIYSIPLERIHPESAVRGFEHGYLHIDVKADRLVGTFFDNAKNADDTFTITKSADTTPPPPPPPVTNSTFDKTKALNFIKSMYNPNTGMLNECPTCSKVWLWSDQLVGQIALKHIDPQMATNVENKMNSYGIPMYNPWATLDPQYRNNFAVGGSMEKQVGTSNVWYSDYSASNQLPCNEYADIAFLKTIHLFKTGQATAAEQCYESARYMWDGTGMKDKGSITGEYAVYKTALGMLAEKITGFAPLNIPANYFDRFQAANGGVTTDITGGQPKGSQNVETTFAVLAALDPKFLEEPVMPEPTPQPTSPTLLSLQKEIDTAESVNQKQDAILTNHTQEIQKIKNPASLTKSNNNK